MNKQLYAFWRYDRFPYVLGGEVIDIKENGKVEVKGYEGYALFNPIIILSYEQGLSIKNKLNQLTLEHSDAITKVETEYCEKIREQFPEYIRNGVV